ncbi:MULTISPECIES: recombinase family protein [Pseudomonas]|jgi:putative DNA-invertase from lambdoid prophage Rac|uniref:recombinase family protein n=1 Tax=Pseudomonas TaxID=286 RepID=UPI000C885E81|nr:MULTISPECIES: recombinase family protein [Pseudomonas]PMZ72690.1 resolvase [Pseudomonas sp. GW247-3R2A]PMY72469.1 resolvase [Pseudomonas sp. MPR-R3A]PMY97806.1 resolvase [Pseudomonas sp. FW305-124]PNA91945.1 resolvase [Pseudomonas sp. FW300-E2]PNB02600.1 resolvase [Pseudomonas sp. MPR-AND1B]
MTAILAYLRVSTDDQSTEAQRHTISQRYNVAEWFSDEATSGASKALQRKGFEALYAYARKGDTVVVAAIDRLGRDTIDVLESVEALKVKGVTVVSMREGFDLSSPVGKAMLTMLAAVAELERTNIKARQMAGIQRARAHGKKLGAPKVIDDKAVAAWRSERRASIADTAKQWCISTAAVKRACRMAQINLEGV